MTVTDASGSSASSSSIAIVTNAPLALHSMFVLPLLRVATLSATFIDANPFANVLEFQAMMNRGDGTTTRGIVTKNVPGNGFSVSGLHIYVRAGRFTITLTIAEREGQPSIQGTRTVVILL